MAYIFAKHLGKPLYIHDTSSNLSVSYHLIQDTFLSRPDVKYTTKTGISVYNERVTELRAYINTLSAQEVRELAKGVFTFTPAVRSVINTAVKDLPPIDLGIHIRTGDKITTGEMKAISLDTYIEAIRSYQRSIQKNVVTLYVMTDNETVVPLLRSNLGPSVHCVALKSPVSIPNGHDQGRYNSLHPDLKQKAFYHFLTELYILQNAPHSICTFSSNIGRFLYMTRESVDGITSLDVQDFYLLEHLRR